MARTASLQNDGVYINMSKVFIFCITIFCLPLAVFGQDDPVIEISPAEDAPETDVVIPSDARPPNMVQAETELTVDDGKTIQVSNNEFRETHRLRAGDKVTLWYTKKGIEGLVKLKGKITDSDGRTIVIGEEAIEIKNIKVIKVPFSMTTGRRVKGLGKVGIGTAVLGAGVGIVYFSSRYLKLNGPQFVFGTFGTVVGVGVGSIGGYLIFNGAKNVFRTRKCPIDKGWKISVR